MDFPPSDTGGQSKTALHCFFPPEALLFFHSVSTLHLLRAQSRSRARLAVARASNQPYHMRNHSSTQSLMMVVIVVEAPRDAALA